MSISGVDSGGAFGFARSTHATSFGMDGHLHVCARQSLAWLRRNTLGCTHIFLNSNIRWSPSSAACINNLDRFQWCIFNIAHIKSQQQEQSKALAFRQSIVLALFGALFGHSHIICQIGDLWQCAQPKASRRSRHLTTSPLRSNLQRDFKTEEDGPTR